ncbi:hypothetical protein [Spongorhabdus nitratireducens]
MSPHDNDGIDNIGELRLSPDDVRDPRGSGAPKSRNRPVSSAEKGSSSWLSGLLLVLLLAVSGVAGWQIWELQQSLKAADHRISVLQAGIEQVTGQVFEAGNSIAQNESNLQNRLKHMDSEIRKLWDIANKRNRRWIEEGKSQTKELDKQLDKLQESIAALDKSLKQEASQLDKLAEGHKGLQKEQDKHGEQLANLQKLPVDKLAEQIAEQQARLKLISGEQKQLKVSLDKRLAGQQEALKSMDTYRQQINSKLLQLQEALRDLQAAPASQAQLQIH